MENPYYDFTVPLFARSLTNLMAILGKAKVYAEENNLSEAVMLNYQLAPDMFPLIKQIQICSDNAKGASARFAGVEIPSMPDTEKTFDELIARIDKTLAFLGTLQPEQFADAASRKIILPWTPEGMYFEAQVYLKDLAIANFYFHYATAYDILRAQGLEIGKTDYVGNLEMKKLVG